jgi:hypothetical protein
MKQVLLLVAIYSLIIHQSHKNAKEMITSKIQKKTTKVTPLLVKPYQQQQIVSRSFIYGSYSFIRSNNMAGYVGWSEKRIIMDGIFQ